MVKMDFSKFESKFWKSRVWYHRYKNCKPSHLVRLTILLETVHFVPNEKKSILVQRSMSVLQILYIYKFLVWVIVDRMIINFHKYFDTKSVVSIKKKDFMKLFEFNSVHFHETFETDTIGGIIKDHLLKLLRKVDFVPILNEVAISKINRNDHWIYFIKRFYFENFWKRSFQAEWQKIRFS